MKWIKASERLPEENREYFVIDNGIKNVGIFSDGFFWSCDEKLRVSKWLDESAPVDDVVEMAKKYSERYDDEEDSDNCKSVSTAAYEAGHASRQPEIDALQKRVEELEKSNEILKRIYRSA